MKIEEKILLRKIKGKTAANKKVVKPQRAPT